MQNLTLQQLFGENATQNEEWLIINKADLKMLAASENNRAEQLFVALILQVWGEFEGLITDEIGKTLVDETGEALGYDQSGLYEKLNVWFWKRQFTKERRLDTFVIDIFLSSSSMHNMPLAANQSVY